MENQITATTLRQVFEQKNAIDRTAQMIAEREIGKTHPHIYITVEGISLDDDPDFPTVIIMARENWQGNCEDHTFVLPLEEFAAAYEGAWA